MSEAGIDYGFRTLPILSRAKRSFTHSCLCSILYTAYLVEVIGIGEQLGCLSHACKLVLC